MIKVLLELESWNDAMRSCPVVWVTAHCAASFALQEAVSVRAPPRGTAGVWHEAGRQVQEMYGGVGFVDTSPLLREESLIPQIEELGVTYRHCPMGKRVSPKIHYLRIVKKCISSFTISQSQLKTT